MKATKQRLVLASKRKLLTLAVASCFMGEFAHANPTGPSVAQGQAAIASQGNVLTVTNTPGTVINWQSFSIASQEITRFLQQSAASTVLNRVVGVNPSTILGTLQSNGRVFLINPNGITIGAGGTIDVAGFLASTLNLSDADFLAGRYRFTQSTGTGSVVNQGTINTATGGMVYLVGQNVENQGIIKSPKGEILLAAGKSIELVDAGMPEIRVQITAPDSQALNLGQLLASGGRIGMYGGLVRQGGVANANTAVVGENGKIVFKAVKDVQLDAGSVTTANGVTDGAGGGTVSVEGATITNAGTVQANAANNASAGSISMVAQDTLTLESSSRVEAKGADRNSEGGAVRFYSFGDAVARNGQVIDISGGTESGNAGSGEFSSANFVSLGGMIVGNAAPGFKKGSFLIDPVNFSFTGGTISANTTVQAEDNISIDGSATINSGITLTLLADHDDNGGSPTPGVWDTGGGGTGTIGVGSITRSGAFTIAGTDSTSSLIMYAGGGGIGTSGTPILTSMNGGSVSVFTNNPAQVGAADTFISNTGAVALAGVTSGAANNFSLTSSGSISVSGAVNTGNTGNTNLTTTGGTSNNIAVGANNVGNATGNTVLTASGAITGGVGTVSGADVTLASDQGVGTSGTRVKTAATTLAANAATAGGVFVSEADGATLQTIGGVANSAAVAAYDVTAAGTLTVGTGGVNTGSSTDTNLTTTGGTSNNIAVGGSNVGNATGNTVLTASGAITGGVGTVSGAGVTLAAGTSVGTTSTPINTTATTLNLSGSGTGDVVVTESDGATLAAATTGSGQIKVVSTTGDLTVASVASSGNITLTASAGSVLDDGTTASISSSAGTTSVTATGVGKNIGTAANPLDINAPGGAVTLTASGGAVHVNTVGAGDVDFTSSVDNTGNFTTQFTQNGKTYSATYVDGAAGNFTVRANGNILDTNGTTILVPSATFKLASSATAGSIGTATKPILTTAGTLDLTGTTTGNVVVNESDGATLALATTGSGQITVVSTTGDLSVGTVSTAGDVTLTATSGAIADGNGVANNVTASSLTVSAGAGIALDAAAATLTADNTGTGNVNVTNAGDVTLATTFRNQASGGTLNLTATDGSIDTSTVAVSTNDGALTLAAQATGGTARTLTVGSGGVATSGTVAGSSITLQGADGVALGGNVNAGAGNVVVNANTGDTTPDAVGAITRTAGTVTGANVTAAAATGIDLTTATGMVDLTSTAGPVQVQNTGSLNVTTLSIASPSNANLTLTSTGQLTLPAVNLSTGTGNIDLQSNGGTFATTGSLTTTSGNISLTGSGGITLDHNLTTSGGNINVNNPAILGTNVQLSTSASAGGITTADITGGGNNLTVVSGGADSIASATGINTLNLNKSGGGISFLGTVGVNTLTTTAANYNVAFNAGNTAPNSNTTTAIPTATFNNTGTITLGNETGDVSTFANGLNTTSASGTSLAGTVQTNGTTMSLGNAIVTQSATIQTTNGAPAGAPLNVTSISGTGVQALTIDSGTSGALVIGNTSNPLTLNVPGANTVNFGPITAAGDVTVNAQGSINLNGAVNSAGSLTVNTANGFISTGGNPIQGTTGVTFSASDGSGTDVGTVTVGAGGISTSGGPLLLKSADGMTINGPLASNNGTITLVAGNAPGMTSLGIPLATNAGGAALGAVAINAPVRAGTGNVTIYSTGPVSQVLPAADAGVQTSNALTVRTYNDTANGATIDMENDKLTGGVTCATGNAGTGNCATQITLETRQAGDTGTGSTTAFPGGFAASEIRYKSISGTQIIGIGTASDVLLEADSWTLNAGAINGGNVNIVATGSGGGGNINVGIAIPTSFINNNQTGGSLNLRAARDITIQPGGSIGTQGSRFDHNLVLAAGDDIAIQGSIFLNGDLNLRANAAAADLNGNAPLTTTGTVSIATPGATPVEVLAKNITVGDAARPVNAITMTAGTAGTGQSADAILKADSNLSINTSGNLSATGGSATASAPSATPTTADTLLSGTTTDVVVGGNLALTGGTSTITSGAGVQQEAHASTKLEGKVLSLRVAGNAALAGGVANAATGGNTSTASASVVSTATLSPIVQGDLTLTGGTSLAQPVSGQAAVADASVEVRTGGDLILNVGHDLTVSGGAAVASTALGGTSAVADSGAALAAMGIKDIQVTHNFNINGGSAATSGGSATATSIAGLDAGQSPSTSLTLKITTGGDAQFLGGTEMGNALASAAILSAGEIKMFINGPTGLVLSGGAGSDLFQLVGPTLISLEGKVYPITIQGSFDPNSSLARGDAFVISGAPPLNLDSLLAAFLRTTDCVTFSGGSCTVPGTSVRTSDSTKNPTGAGVCK